MAPVLIGPRANIRVTCDTSPSNDRSESALAANPLNPYNLVGSSKRFTNPMTYAFSLAAYATFDGGVSWTEAAPLGLLAGWDGTSDPAVAWDDIGNVFLVGLPFQGAEPFAIAVYKSTDGGLTWSAPNLIHSAPGDDKQSAFGDMNPASPHHGNVYAAWDGPGGLLFGRTTDHGATWKGTGTNPVGTSLAPGSFAPQVVVSSDGSVYIFYFNGTEIDFVKSVDGGNSFSAGAAAATGVTPLPGQLPGGIFRTPTVPSACTGVGASDLVVAWPDYRQGVARVYYVRSKNGGNTWLGGASGQPLLTGGAVSAADQHEFQPQVESTPSGDVGCSFYLFGPKGGGTTPLIDVVLAASVNNAKTFVDRATITDAPWDPTVDAVWAHGNPNVTFIGDYFGLASSRLGFFPFWMDTRTGMQEIFTARVAVRPADVYIRDSSSDIGTVPSPGFHWEAPDLIVRRQQDGFTNFADQDLYRDGVTDHFIYGRVTNQGPNPAENVTLAVTVGNYPSLVGLPGSEFRYPQDWYPGDWQTPALQARHLYLGESPAVASLAAGASQILGPIRWPASQIPVEGTWHPCLLAEVRSNNDDSAGGINGAPVSVYPGTCDYGSYFWGDNNICQRNVSYAPVFEGMETRIDFPFLIGNPFSPARMMEIIVHKGPGLAELPMTLKILPVDRKTKAPQIDRERSHGVRSLTSSSRLMQAVAGVAFSVKPGQVHRATLSFTLPKHFKLHGRPTIEVFQRNDGGAIVGGVQLEIVRGRKRPNKRPRARAPKRR
jgi:hypothetical protein